MKLPAAILFALFVTAGLAPADPYSIAKQQAKNAAGGGSSGSQSHSPPSSAAQNNNPAPDPALESMTRNIAALRANFAALNHATNLDASSQKLSLLNNLAGAAQGAKPSANSIKKLADNLIAALAGKEEMRPQQQKLAQQIHAVFNSSRLSAAQQQAIFDGVKKILADGGASSDDTEKVIADLKTIAVETK